MNKTIKVKLGLKDIFLILFIFCKTGVFKTSGILFSILSMIASFFKIGMLPSSILEFLSLGLFSFFVMLDIIKKKKFIITKQMILYGLFVIFACVSYFWSLSRTFSLESMKSILALLVFIIALSNYIDNKESLIKIVKIVVFSNIFVSFKILLLYWIKSGSAAARIQNITGIYFNTVGQVIGFSILFSIYLYKFYNRKVYLYTIIPQFVAIILTESRKSILIPFIGMILMLVLEKNLAKTLKYFFLIFIGSISLIIIINKISPEIYNSINQKLSDLVKYVNGEETNDWSINLRSFFIETGKTVFKFHPIKGIGLNNFAYYVGNYTSYGIERYSHNNYVELLCCLGIVGFGLYYLIYFYILINLLKYKKEKVCLVSLSALLVLMIMEWGVVSYSGCLYHVYILIMYYTVTYQKNLYLKYGETYVK